MKLSLISAIIAIAIAQPVFAQNGSFSNLDEGLYGPEAYFEAMDRTEDGQIGTIFHFNQLTFGLSKETITLETSYGPIVVIINRIPNIDCEPVEACPDSIEIVELPDGLIVYTEKVITKEYGLSAIKVYEYLGS